MEYAIPKNVETTFENDKIVRQTVTMYNISDVELYTRACLSYGAKVVDTFRNILIVEYKKDFDGKIGIIS
jgi:hypothetical protein